MATLLTVHLLFSAVSDTIGGSASALGSVASVADSGIKGADQPVMEAIGIVSDMIQQLVQVYLQPTYPDPATMSPRDAPRADRTMHTRNRIIAIMAAQRRIPVDQAIKKFDDVKAQAV